VTFLLRYSPIPIPEKSEIPGEPPIDEKSEIGSERSQIGFRKVGNVPKKPYTKNTDKEITTTTPHEQAKAMTLVAGEKQDVVVDPFEGGFEEESQRIDDLMKSLASGFTLNGRQFKLSSHQMNEVQACAKRNGAAYVEERIKYARTEAKKNPVTFLMNSLAEGLAATG
jgi:hypothetical protein